MSGDLTLGYVAGKSFLHRTDPLTKLIALTGVIIFAIGAPIDYNFMMLLALLAIVPFSGVGLKTFLTPWKVLIPLWIPFIVLPPILFNLQSGLMGLANDTRTIHLFGYAIAYSQYGLDYGVKIAARGMAIGMASLLVLWTTHPRDLVQSMVEDFRAPYKYAWSVFLALVYVPIVEYESRLRTYALAIRGVKHRKFSMHGLKVHTVPVIFRSLRRGFSSALSMEARGFGATPQRTFRYDLRRPAHVALIRLVVVAVFVTLIALAIMSGRFAIFHSS
ncbi:energy-coupling factor transport system permease protein [Nitrobacteraceae bacterium AZCC 2146]